MANHLLPALYPLKLSSSAYKDGQLSITRSRARYVQSPAFSDLENRGINPSRLQRSGLHAKPRARVFVTGRSSIRHTSSPLGVRDDLASGKMGGRFRSPHSFFHPDYGAMPSAPDFRPATALSTAALPAAESRLFFTTVMPLFAIPKTWLFPSRSFPAASS